MTSGGRQLLRQWWNEPGDYSWVVEFLGPRGFLPGLRAIIGACGMLMGCSVICLLSEHLIEPVAVSRVTVTVIMVAAFAWAGVWWLLPWPTAGQAAILFVLADIGIAVATFIHADPLAALSTTPLFAMTGAFIVFFYGPRANAIHVTFATTTIVAAAIRLALSDNLDAVQVAIAKAVIALIVTVAVFPFVQFGFWLVRNNAVESLTDPLTDLANRRGLANYLARKSGKLTSSATPLCAFVVDLDGFKQINDKFGHTVGDSVITRTAERIRVAVGPSAFVARTGGEEFVAVDLLTLQAAAEVAERMRVEIENLDAPKATASIGVAVGDIRDIAEFETIHRCADQAMYAAKREGGNRIALGGVVRAPRFSARDDEIPFKPVELSSDGQ